MKKKHGIFVQNIIGVIILCVSLLITVSVLASNNITYQAAKSTGNCYSCTFAVDSFGGMLNFEAKIKGDNFIARSQEWGFVFARIDGIAYVWRESGGVVEKSEIYQFDLKKVVDANRATVLPENELESYFLFVEPRVDSPCVPITQADIILPNVSFVDETQWVIDELRKSKEEKEEEEIDKYGISKKKERDSFDSLPFSVCLPPCGQYSKVMYSLTAANLGMKDPDEFEIDFFLANDYMQIRVKESKITHFYNPPTDCRPFIPSNELWKLIGSVQPCQFVITSKRGRNIYKRKEDSSPNITEFYFTIDNTLVRLVFYGPSYPHGDFGMSKEKIAEFADSFEKIDYDAISNFKQM